MEVRHFRLLIASIQQKLHLKKLRVRSFGYPRVQQSEIALQKTDKTAPTCTEIILSPSKHSFEHNFKSSNESSGSKISAKRDCIQQEDHRSVILCVKGEETVMNNGSNNENLCKQKTHKRDIKRWANSNTLEEPLLQD